MTVCQSSSIVGDIVLVEIQYTKEKVFIVSIHHFCCIQKKKKMLNLFEG